MHDTKCPYTILNPCVLNTDILKRKNSNLMRPILILRIKYHTPQCEDLHEIKRITKTKETEKIDYDEYSSNIADQIAVLASLVLGIRLKAGEVNIIFNNENDTFGDTVAYNNSFNPPQFLHENNYETLPSALSFIYKKDIYFDITIFKDYLLFIIKLDPKYVDLLIKAAKLYRDTLWLIESQPQLSWIMLVSAIEVIAKDYVKLDPTPIEIFQENEEELFIKIKTQCDQELLNKIAHKFVKKIKYQLSPDEALKQFRELQKLSQNELAEITGIPQSNISALESGAKQLGRDRALIIA